MTRDEQKDERRRRIVEAARKLVRETGSTDFPVGDLARRAGLSVATLYNLLGSKSTVLYILLNESLDHLISAASAVTDEDPVCAALEASKVAGEAFTADHHFLRPLYRYLLGVFDPVHRPAFMARALAFWEQRLAGLEAAHMLPAGLGLTELARDHQIFFAGALDLWVQGELSDEQFRAQVRHAGLLRLLALNTREMRPALIAELAKIAPIIREATANPRIEAERA